MVTGRRLSLTVLLAVTATAALGVLSPAIARSATFEPDGTTTLLDDGAWSWFEDERAVVSHDGTLLTVSAVVGEHSELLTPGTVALVELDLVSGSRRIVDLGRAEADDHNSAAIWATPTGEILTSWARHSKDPYLRMHRRRTDGSWIRLPRFDTDSPATYSNLLASTPPGGPTTRLYDFYRGERWDPSALRSDDLGRTWIDLGRLLRDPADDSFGRPYVNYTADGTGRIDLIATENHPANETTSVYHGYVVDGRLHDSFGNDLGMIGSAVPVTALTPVWTQVGDERAWTADVEIDPATGRPVAAFSVRHSPDDHRYWHARWDGTAWVAHEVAHAGTALYEPEIDYTGLVSLDPDDPDRLVISTDVDPVTGAPLLSATDGLQHHELFFGEVAADGSVAWLPVTDDSTADNLRPVMTTHPSGARAMLWLRGDYRTFRDYDLSVVGVVRRADGTTVAAGPATTAPVIDTVPVATPHPVPATLIPGEFDRHAATDLLMTRAGPDPEQLLLGDEQRHPTAVMPPSVNGSYGPVAGDFDGDGLDDILWYAPGPASDSLWLGSGAGTFLNEGSRTVNGTYDPASGDFDGDGTNDILWYAPGPAPDYLWRGTPEGFVAGTAPAVNGTYDPASGDFDGDGTDDILWYAPGPGHEWLWSGSTTGFSSTATREVHGVYRPAVGDFDGNGTDDVHWYAPGPAPDYLWWSTSGPLEQSSLYTNL